MGGSQREEDYEKLTTRMKEMGIATEPLYWYLDLLSARELLRLSINGCCGLLLRFKF